MVSCPAYLDLPNFHSRIKLPNLEEHKPLFACLFGSAIQEPRFETLARRFLCFSWETKERVSEWANDVDILVVTREVSQETVRHTKALSCRIGVGDSYSFEWVYREFPNLLHLLIAGKDPLTAALIEKDADAVRIMRQSDFLCGDQDAYRDMKKLVADPGPQGGFF